MYKDIKTISNLYDNIIFDMWGVLGYTKKNGLHFHIYDSKLIENINILPNNKYILSNTLWTTSYIYKIFQEYNLNIPLDNIFTIPQIIAYHIKDTNAHVIQFDIISSIQKKILSEYHKNSYQDASIIIIPSFCTDNLSGMKIIFNQLKDIENKTIICLNADHYSPANGKILPTSGLLAQWLIDKNIPVTILGKPHKNMFEPILNMLKGSSIMIGDTIENDILGAHNANIDSALVSTGNNENKNFDDIQAICKKLKIKIPTHFVKLF